MSVNEEGLKKTLYFDENDVKAFSEIHPGHGSFTWFLRECLRSYVEQYRNNANEQVARITGSIDMRGYEY